ncbi:hypothetical protein BVRB_5g121780 [Beta vulgaris subsp. vulgaris]|nr:hypothetical protein BVRB_5g121780 [Beta vulgaris subsp. vulgaris]
MFEYMTFSAINKSSGKTGVYQAALKTLGGYVLGLFRDWCNDKILAVLSITGAEEDIAARRMRRES